MRQEGDSAHRGACRLTGVRQCPRPPRGVMPRQTSGGREGYINTAKAGGSLPWEGQQALFCCVTCVSGQFVKGRGGDSLLRAAVCGSASGLNPCILG